MAGHRQDEEASRPYYTDKERNVYRAGEDVALTAEEVRGIYEGCGSSLTQFAYEVGFSKTGGGRKVANKVLAHYGITPEKHHFLRLDDITREQAEKACEAVDNATALGYALGAKSEDRASQFGRQVIKKFDLDVSHFKWRATDMAGTISKEDSITMIERAATLRELGGMVQEKTHSKSDRIYLAHRLIALYGLDDAKFRQNPADGMTRDEVLQIYESATSASEFMRLLGYEHPGRFPIVRQRFGLPDPPWKKKARELKKTAEKQLHDCHEEQEATKDITDYVPTLERLCSVRGRACEECGRTIWQGHLIPLQVHHINGNHEENTWENVKLLCCNCHDRLTAEMTGTKQRAAAKTDDEFISALRTNPTVHAALMALGLRPCRYSYRRCYRLIEEHRISPHYSETLGLHDDRKEL